MGSARNRIEQGPRVGVTRVAKDCCGRAALDNFTVLHHTDEIANLRRHAQVVRDEDDGEAESLAKSGKQLPLYRRLDRREV
jgi:hypothetical protein